MKLLITIRKETNVTKYLDYEETVTIANKFKDARETVTSDPMTAANIVVGIIGLFAPAIGPLLTIGAVGVGLEQFIFSNDFSVQEDFYRYLQDLLGEDKYKKAEIKQEYVYRVIKTFGDHFEGWYLNSNKPTLIGLQCTNGLWIKYE